MTGLYAFLAGALGALLFSTSRPRSIEPDSTIAPMMSSVSAQSSRPRVPTTRDRIVLLALIVGVVILAGVARLGFLADSLSRVVMSGFLSGFGITVVVGQLHVVLGLPATSGPALAKLEARSRGPSSRRRRVGSRSTASSGVGRSRPD